MMEIDKQAFGADEAIVLFPRSYNKRGDERLHSVQGVTLDGKDVNIKLRIDPSMMGKESAPSISEFSREDVKAKNPCLAFPENGPGNREGILLLTGCEEDGDKNRKGLQSYTARWAYVLASHSDSPEPVFGLGRVVMIADSHAAKRIHAELSSLESNKPEGWEALAEHRRKALNDPMLFSYYGQIYETAEESTLDSNESLIEFARATFVKYTAGGVVGGILIRLLDGSGNLIPGFSAEVFPRWLRNDQYQDAEDVLNWFFRSNSKRIQESGSQKFLAMPIKRYSCGPSFKNYYFLKKPEENLQKIRKRFLINNEPTVCNVAFALTRREDNGDSFLSKYYTLSNPISSVSLIGHVIEEGDPAPDLTEGVFSNESRLITGLSSKSALSFPAWYEPQFINEIEIHVETDLDLHTELSEDTDDLSELFSGLSDDEVQQSGNESADQPITDDHNITSAQEPVSAENEDIINPVAQGEIVDDLMLKDSSSEGSLEAANESPSTDDEKAQESDKKPMTAMEKFLKEKGLL